MIYDLSRKKAGRRRDWLSLDPSNLEIACGEGETDAEIADNLVSIQSSRNTPKMMHSIFKMLCTKADNDEGAIRELEVVGFVFSCKCYGKAFTR